MYLIIEDNQNCQGEERVFASSGPKKLVECVQVEQNGKGLVWCDVVGIEENGVTIPATAQLVEDSSDGTAWLVSGGAWGLRFKLAGTPHAWDLKNPDQWGRPFLVLDSAGNEIQFTS